MGGTSFRLLGWVSGVTTPRFTSATLTALAALLLRLLLLLPGILPSLALPFSFPFLPASADFLFILWGEDSWIVEVILGSSV